MNPLASVLDPDWSRIWEHPLTHTEPSSSEWSWQHLSTEALPTPPLPLTPLSQPPQPQPQPQPQSQPCHHPTTTIAIAPPLKRRKPSITTPTTIRRSQQQQQHLVRMGHSKPSLPAPRKSQKTKPISSHIPFEIWLEIFSYCAPSQLAKLRRINSSFKAFIDDEKIWAKSRRNTFPNYPEPMYGFPENYMWNLWKGSGCEICGAARFKKCYWTWGIRLCTGCFKEHRIRGDEIPGDREFVNAALVCLRHCFVSGKFVSTQRGNYYGLGGGDPCYWKDEVAAFREEYNNKKAMEIEHPGILATFIEFEKDKVKVQMETAVKMCEFERQEAAARREELAEIRRQRLISIPEKCKQHFNPPIPEGVLDLIPSYQTALKAGNILTDRGWKTLVTKISSERSRAEAHYQKSQEEKEQAHRKYTTIRRRVRRDEISDNRNLKKFKVAMPKLLKYARDFIKREGGHLILDQAKAQSFVLETMKYCRRAWYEKNPQETLPFRSAYFLWEEVLEGMFGMWRDMDFCCEYCSLPGTWEEIVFHLASEHHKKPGMQGLARYPVEFLPEEKYNYKRPIPNWDGIEWPENIPVVATGPKYIPKFLKEKPLRAVPSSSTSSAAPNKPRKPKKPGTTRDDPICMFASNSFAKFQKPHTSPRMLIDRVIIEVNELHVPKFFQLSIFFRKIVTDFKRYKLRVEFNELYYEFIRIYSQPHPPPWFSHSSIACHTCLHTWEGEENIVTLMQHFFDKHHLSHDWRKDMLLMPGPPDVLQMLNTINDRQIEYHWDQKAVEHQLDSATAREKMALADQNEEVLCSIEELKKLRVLKQGGDVREGVERRAGEILIRDENSSGDRKRKRDAKEGVDEAEEEALGEGKGKGKEREGSDTSFDELMADDEDWEVESLDLYGEFSESDYYAPVDSEIWHEDEDLPMEIDGIGMAC